MDLDLNDLRSIVTVVSLVAFLLLVFAVWRPSRRDEFALAARAPFDGEEPTPGPARDERGGGR